MKTILAIDPSIRHVGWAFHQYEYIIPKWDGGVLEFKENYEIDFIAYSICQKLKDKLQHIQPDIIITEKPSFMSSAKGQIAAQQGYTLDLAFLNGYIISYFRKTLYIPKIIQYTPQQWKGQVPKSATLAKFKREFPQINADKLTDHEIDARMMIHHYLTTK